MGKDSIHAGHRGRLKQAMLQSNFAGVSDINLLEALLFYSIPRSNTNEIAHRLLQAFGSVDAVFEADYEDLLHVEGVGENSAFLIKLVNKTRKKMELPKKGTVITGAAGAADCFRPYFVGEKNEKMLALLLDNAGCFIKIVELGTGVINSVSFDNRKLMEAAMRCGCATVILAHNHPHGLPNPSGDDLRLTFNIREMLRPVGILLYDHLIYADGHWFCFSELKDASRYLSKVEVKKIKKKEK